MKHLLLIPLVFVLIPSDYSSLYYYLNYSDKGLIKVKYADGKQYNSFGFWVAKMNSEILRDMGYAPYKELPTSRPNRDIGLYKSPSKFQNELKDFLLKFRDIVESNKNIDEKLN